MSATCHAPGCEVATLCGDCLSLAVLHLTGVARSRGIRWAESVALRRPDLIGKPWPDDSRARAMARSKVAGISSDPRVAERLEGEVVREAARWWGRLSLPFGCPKS